MSLLQNVSDQLAGPKHSPSQHRSSRDHPGHPHLPPGSHKSPSRWAQGKQGVLMELTGTAGRGHLLQPSPEWESAARATSSLGPSHSQQEPQQGPGAQGLGAPGDPLFQHESRGPTSCWALSGNTPGRPPHSETNEQNVINKCKKRRQRMARVFGSSGCQGCLPEARHVAGEGTGWSKVQAQQALGTSQTARGCLLPCWCQFWLQGKGFHSWDWTGSRDLAG